MKRFILGAAIAAALMTGPASADDTAGRTESLRIYIKAKAMGYVAERECPGVKKNEPGYQSMFDRLQVDYRGGMEADLVSAYARLFNMEFHRDVDTVGAGPWCKLVFDTWGHGTKNRGPLLVKQDNKP